MKVSELYEAAPASDEDKYKFIEKKMADAAKKMNEDSVKAVPKLYMTKFKIASEKEASEDIFRVIKANADGNMDSLYGKGTTADDVLESMYDNMMSSFHG